MTRSLKILFLFLLLTANTFAQQKLNVWLSAGLWSDTTKEVTEWREKNIKGFLLMNEAKPFANAHRDLLKNCMIFADVWFDAWTHEYPEVQIYYADEAYTSATEEQRNVTLRIQKEHADRLILSEIPPAFFEKLDDKRTKFVYSGYNKFLFRIFSINISCPFANQESSVKWLIEAYPNRVPFIWINIDQVNDFADLIKFARENKIDIWIYAGQNDTKTNVLITNGNLFLKELNK